MTEKPSNPSPDNPKDIQGIKKVPFSCVPLSVFAEACIPIDSPVVAEVGVGLFEGDRKYSRFNYLVVGIRVSIYFDATMRHSMARHAGQEIDPESKLPHLTKMMASMVVLRAAMLNGMWTDDRPPPMRTNKFDMRTPEGQIAHWFYSGGGSPNLDICLIRALKMLHDERFKQVKDWVGEFDRMNKDTANLLAFYSTPEMKEKGYPKQAFVWSDKPLSAEDRGVVDEEWLKQNGERPDVPGETMPVTASGWTQTEWDVTSGGSQEIVGGFGVWIDHQSSEPVVGGRVEVILRNDEQYIDFASRFDWRVYGRPRDIVRYRHVH